ncbi:hypothetical protein [Paraburkholderia bannensis]|uniref:hypothetical protein n=1 Tax=Paraburkholderia bannensis TaxID=765414 RepID=UPI002AAF1AC9|nr:hypothetical protein [Paraburkholderia bannensis]
MDVIVYIKNSNVYYYPAKGTRSSNYDYFPPPQESTIDRLIAWASWYAPEWAIPATGFEISSKHNVQGEAPSWIWLSAEDFVRFKNGGKRLPSTDPNKTVTDKAGNSWARARDDRNDELVEEGDVGPYARGDGNLKRRNLSAATTSRPATWVPGGAGTPTYYETDPQAHVQMQMNRDHQNNQNALKKRGLNAADGGAIAIPQWIHMNGYTFGNKAKDTKKKKNNPDSVGQSRSQWIAAHPSEALFKEIYQTLRFYADAGKLTYEIVGSFRYLYKYNVKNMGYAPTLELDRLIMHYLNLAT